MYRLEVREADGHSVSYALRVGATLSVGRHGSSDIVLDDGSVSRSHCLIYVGASQVEIEDLGSTNGVRIAGRPIVGRAEVPPGAELTIGKLPCRLIRVVAEAAPDETTIQARPSRGSTGGRA